MSDHFNVVFSGEIIDGFSSSDVRQNFAKVFKIELHQAEKYFAGKTKTLKKEADHKTAYQIKSVMEKFGAVVELQPTIKPRTFTLDSISLEPIEGREKEGFKTTFEGEYSLQTKFSCPKCKFIQQQGGDCISCGIIFEKYLEKQNTEITTPDSSIRNQPKDRTDFSNLANPPIDNINKNALIAASIFAIVGAFIWKFIALVFDMEFGFIAWIIGGSVGFSAAYLGARGQKSGLICGTLAFVAIIGGKFMVYDAIINQSVNSVSIENASMGEEIELFRKKVEIYYDEVDSEQSKKVFIYENGYTEAETINNISESDLEYFDDAILPVFETFYDAKEEIDDFKTKLVDKFDDTNILALIFSNLYFLDFLFLFLGVTTAYRLADNGYQIFKV